MDATRRSDLVKTGLWLIVWLVLLDGAVTLLFPLPADPREQPNAIEQYFSYGLSVEAKIKRLLGSNDQDAAPIVQAGWPRTAEQKQDLIKAFDTDKRRIAMYGQSFTFHVAAELKKLMPESEFALMGGPGAPLNVAYARYLADRHIAKPDTVVIGICASSLPAINTMTHMTRNVERPFPYTYPRYVWNGSECDAVEPIVQDCEQLRKSLGDRAKREVWLAQLSAHDAYYSPFMFRETALDQSTCLRLLRRAWGLHRIRARQMRVHGPGGFVDSCDTMQAVRWMIKMFAEQAILDGVQPMVILFNNHRDFSDHLYLALGPTLAELGIPHLSTHEIASTDEPRHFLRDGHFTREVNIRIAAALRDLINRHVPATP